MEGNSWIPSIFPVSYTRFVSVTSTWIGDGNGYAWIQHSIPTITLVTIYCHESHGYQFSTPCHIIAIGY